MQTASVQGRILAAVAFAFLLAPGRALAGGNLMPNGNAMGGPATATPAGNDIAVSIIPATAVTPQSCYWCPAPSARLPGQKHIV